MHGIRHILVAAIVAVVALGVLRPGVAWGQGVGGEVGVVGAGADAAGVVQIAMESFGVGGVIRPGEWAGMRVALTDSAATPRAVAVRLHLRDDDGDEMLVERRVTLNPGRALGLWMYARMPWTVTDTTLFMVTVHALSSPEDGTGEVREQIAAARVKPQRVVEAMSDLVGVIGTRHMGLTQLESRDATGTGAVSMRSRMPTSHHAIEVLLGLTPQGLPDVWMGLSGFGVLVWSDGAPSGVGSDLRARAVREWVRRGGHLVVMVPAVGSEWFAESNPLRGLMPAVTPRVVLDASLERYRSLLTSADFASAPLPERVGITTFEPAAHAEPGEATAVIQGVHGIVVARRLEGAGMVTVVGLPLDAVDREVVRADAFWHRVLGYRFDTPLPEAVAKMLARPGFPVVASRYIGLQITQTSRAGAGVMLALLLFIVYWLVAGPLGHWVLGRMGMVRHSWVVFVGSIAVFAVAAWIGSSMTRPTKVRASHLTFLDHVHGQSTQRTTTWASVLLPEYGEATIRLDEPGVNDQWRQAIAVWSDSQGGSTPTPFPDARAYVYDLRAPEQIRVPTRGTIKQFRFDWLGGKRWSTPIAEGPGWEPRITERGGIQGRLTHDLPGPLEDVIVVFQPGQTGEGHALSEGDMRVVGRAQRWAVDSWSPGEVLDLGEFAAVTPGKQGAELMRPWEPELVSVLAQPWGVTQAEVYNERRAEVDYRRLSLYSMLNPPNWRVNTDGVDARPLVARMEGQHLDLGRWATQPMVMIIGTVRRESLSSGASGAPSPTPMMIREGSGYREIPSEGRTIVRWVYPLSGPPARFDGDSASVVAP